MRHEVKKKKFVDPGSQGRPKWYPSPEPDQDILFFIQRNQNQNTIVYRVNRTSEGLIDQYLPMDAYWIDYDQGGIRTELNDLQNRLAFGYDSEKINNNLYKFQFVAYKEMTFYILEEGDAFKVIYDRNGRKVILENIYVYALEFGVFPVVRYVEFFGRDFRTNEKDYLKITIEK